MKHFKRMIASLFIVSMILLAGCQQPAADEVEQLSAEDEYTTQPVPMSINAATFGN